MKKQLFSIAALVLGFSAAAQATTITFDDVDGYYSNYVSNGPSQYHSQGFTFAAINPAGDYDGAHFHEDYFGPGTVITHDNTGDYQDIWRLTSSTGFFDLTSFVTISNGLLWSVNGGAFQATVSGLNTVNLTGIQALDFKLENPYGCCGDGLSEFTVNATNGTSVPEPTTLALFGLGLAGLVSTRRRKA